MTTLAKKLLPVFRANVETLLTAKGWGRGDLAGKMKCTPSYITQVLGGHRGVGLDALEGFADALGVPADELIKVRRHARKAS